jgi:beta-glucuronidase
MRLAVLLPLVCALMAATLATSAAGAERPRVGALYADGPSGRYLLGGQWLFRLDKEDRGLREGFHRQTGTDGWSPVTVPNAWNLGDDSVESMMGSTGWYRKDFELPEAAAALHWVVRFESVNYRTRAWLNGRPIGRNKGAYIPFELQLSGLKRHGTNRLVVRVDSRRYPTDFPPSGMNTATGLPAGGWWNYSGILREVYLRRIDTIDWKQVVVRPVLPCGACDATVNIRLLLRNVTPETRRVTVRGRFGTRSLKFGTLVIPPRGVKSATTTFKLRRPRLWSPTAPNLYTASFEAHVARAKGKRGRRLAAYDLHSGVRSVRVSSDGRLVLNGQLMNFRGVGFHEDSKAQGFAIGNADRDWLVSEAKALGGTVMRTHYPMHPYTHELADRLGMLLWSEIPVYSNKTQYLKKRTVRVLAAKELRRNIETFQNHPSVMLWSIGNELSTKPGPVQGYYIKRAANLARALDPTRPVGLAVAGYPSAGCQPEYAPLDVIGINEYFGWYPGPSGQIFDRTKLSPYLDSVRQCYPDKAIVVTEFGAEANREGPIEEKGTWAFQQEFVAFHLGVHASKPWLSGSIYWALNEFRVRPGWDGGNPRPAPPVHQKGLVTYDRVRKPAWFDVQRLFQGVAQYAVPSRRRPR